MIYLDSAATSRFKPRKVLQAQYKYTARSANAGRGSHREAIRISSEIEETRRLISEYLGKKRVIFTKNCTEALNLFLFGSDIRGEVLTSPFEHNSVLRPLKKLERDGKIKMKFFPRNVLSVTPEDVENHITSRTSLVAVSHISNVTGSVQDVAKIGEICRKKRVKFLCDMAQSLGHVETEYDKIDVIAASGHKGLHGPQGTGILAISDDIRLKPLILGGTGTSTIDLIQPETYPDGYESGTQNAAGIIALKEGFLWTVKRIDKIGKKLAYLTKYLVGELKECGMIRVITPDDAYSGVVSFNIRGMRSVTVADILDKEYGIAVRAGLHCAPMVHKTLGTLETGAVRVSMDVDTTKKEIDRLVLAIKEIIAVERSKYR